MPIGSLLGFDPEDHSGRGARGTPNAHRRSSIDTESRNERSRSYSASRTQETRSRRFFELFSSYFPKSFKEQETMSSTLKDSQKHLGLLASRFAHNVSLLVQQVKISKEQAETSKSHLETFGEYKEDTLDYEGWSKRTHISERRKDEDYKKLQEKSERKHRRDLLKALDKGSGFAKFLGHTAANVAGGVAHGATAGAIGLGGGLLGRVFGTRRASRRDIQRQTRSIEKALETLQSKEGRGRYFTGRERDKYIEKYEAQIQSLKSQELKLEEQGIHQKRKHSRKIIKNLNQEIKLSDKQLKLIFEEIEHQRKIVERQEAIANSLRRKGLISEERYQQERGKHLQSRYNIEGKKDEYSRISKRKQETLLERDIVQQERREVKSKRGVRGFFNRIRESEADERVRVREETITKHEKALKRKGYSEDEARQHAQDITSGFSSPEDIPDKRKGFFNRLRRKRSGKNQGLVDEFGRPIARPSRLGKGFRGLGSLGRGFARFAPGIGLALGGSVAASRFREGDIFGGLSAGAAGIASVIPGLGPLIGIAIEAIAGLVPDNMKKWFNTQAKPLFSKLWSTITGTMSSTIGALFGKSSEEGSKILGAKITNITANFGDLFDNIAKIVKFVGPPLLKTLGFAAGVIGTIGLTLLEGITGILKHISDFIAESPEKGIVQSFKDNIIDPLTNFIANIGSILWNITKNSAKLIKLDLNEIRVNNAIAKHQELALKFREKGKIELAERQEALLGTYYKERSNIDKEREEIYTGGITQSSSQGSKSAPSTSKALPTSSTNTAPLTTFSEKKVSPLSKYSSTLEGNIKEAAQKTGISEDYLRTVAYIESKGNPNAVSETGAKGIFQFIESTGKQYGLVGKGFDRRTDERSNVFAGAELAADNATALRKTGITPEPHLLYLAHQQGIGGVLDLYESARTGRDPSTFKRGKRTLRDNIEVNLPSKLRGKGVTAAQFLELWKNKYYKNVERARGSYGESSKIQNIMEDEVSRTGAVPTKSEKSLMQQAKDLYSGTKAKVEGTIESYVPKDFTESLKTGAKAVAGAGATTLGALTEGGTDLFDLILGGNTEAIAFLPESLQSLGSELVTLSKQATQNVFEGIGKEFQDVLHPAGGDPVQNKMAIAESQTVELLKAILQEVSKDTKDFMHNSDDFINKFIRR